VSTAGNVPRGSEQAGAEDGAVGEVDAFNGVGDGLCLQLIGVRRGKAGRAVRGLGAVHEVAGVKVI
jgi:hypothetical protein